MVRDHGAALDAEGRTEPGIVQPARKMNCWTCGLEGHFARDCHSDSGNEVGKTGAPAVFPSTQ